MTVTVLLPGTLCDERVFEHILPHLAEPVVLDYGAFEAADVAAGSLIDAVPPGSLGIAFSLGSWVLLEMLRLAPERFCGLLLLSGNADPDAPDNASMRQARVDTARTRGFGPLFAQDWSLMLGAAKRDDDAIRTLILDMAATVGHDRHARQASLNSTRPDLRELVSNPPVGIHVLAGGQDGLCPCERYERAATGPVSSLTIVAEAGHYTPLEAPDAVLDLIRSTNPEALR